MPHSRRGIVSNILSFGHYPYPPDTG
ncbi:Protein of unknown function [Pyronema omphalodes CBS 100304]|uniref:Uncharacterized protein n=1 Tax=Pyronema omphalodes (strain CBS 100304) TaxID=1076935 RepID=U4LH65_PYROM|nr:Protein of unknown function [Pyronema omphalodes CBS 100304]